MNNVQRTSPIDETQNAVIEPLPATMPAIVHDRYGSPDVLQHRVIETPAVKPDRVVVQVEAAAINPLDFHFMTGTPYLLRLMAGFRRPKQATRGADLAGTVVAVGSAVTGLSVGDRVYGAGAGTFADYALAKPAMLAAMPAGMTAQHAAAMPIAAVTALQALRDHAQVEPGHRVLVIGASGGVGTYAVQIAKHLGCEVVGICSSANVELVRSLGADDVIDYTATESLGDPDAFDAIIDNIGTRALSDIIAALKPHGRYVIVGGPKKGNWVGPLVLPIRAKLRFLRASQTSVSFTASETTAELEALAAMVEAGALRSVIDRTYTLDQTPDAMRYLMTGRARGKVVITPAREVEA